MGRDGGVVVRRRLGLAETGDLLGVCCYKLPPRVERLALCGSKKGINARQWAILPTIDPSCLIVLVMDERGILPGMRWQIRARRPKLAVRRYERELTACSQRNVRAWADAARA